MESRETIGSSEGKRELRVCEICVLYIAARNKRESLKGVSVCCKFQKQTRQGRGYAAGGMAENTYCIILPTGRWGQTFERRNREP